MQLLFIQLASFWAFLQKHSGAAFVHLRQVPFIQAPSFISTLQMHRLMFFEHLQQLPFLQLPFPQPALRARPLHQHFFSSLAHWTHMPPLNLLSFFCIIADSGHYVS